MKFLFKMVFGMFIYAGIGYAVWWVAQEKGLLAGFVTATSSLIGLVFFASFMHERKAKKKPKETALPPKITPQQSSVPQTPSRPAPPAGISGGSVVSPPSSSSQRMVVTENMEIMDVITGAITDHIKITHVARNGLINIALDRLENSMSNGLVKNIVRERLENLKVHGLYNQAPVKETPLIDVVTVDFLISPIPKEISAEIFKAMAKIRENPVTGPHIDLMIDELMNVVDSSLAKILGDIMDLIHLKGFVRKLLVKAVDTALGISRRTGKKLIRDLPNDRLIPLVEWGESMLRPVDMDFTQTLPVPIDAQYMAVCPLSRNDAQKIFDLVDEVKQSPQQGVYSERVIRLVLELADIPINFYIRHPMEMLNVGDFGKKLVNFGIKIVLGLVKSTGKKVVDDLGTEELLLGANTVEILVRPLAVTKESVFIPQDAAQENRVSVMASNALLS
ncbi:hypothetical protein WDW89_11925 [Deltaproteobacteria bacterium TL4]